MAGHEPTDPFSVIDYPGSFLDDSEGGIKGLRIAWSPDLGYAPVDPEVRSACEAAARRFADLGCEVEEASPGFASPAADFTFFTLAATSDADWLGKLSDAEVALLDDPAREFLAFGSRTTGIDVMRANDRRMAIGTACNSSTSATICSSPRSSP